MCVCNDAAYPGAYLEALKKSTKIFIPTAQETSEDKFTEEVHAALSSKAYLVFTIAR
jgi:peptidase E